MAPFRWPKVENDIALLKEIVARRPSKADEWDDIAEFLSSLFSTENNPVKRMQREKWAINKEI